jgi:hypothetical protein
VFKNFILASVALASSLPTAVGGLIGLIAASEKTGFNGIKPAHHKQLVDLVNALLEFLIDHWILYIIACCGLGFFWALMVSEPKAASKREFARRKKARIGKRP